MALSDRARNNRIVDKFLAADPGYVDDIAAQIASGRQQRRSAQMANRAVGAGAFQGASPFHKLAPEFMNPSGAGGRAIMQGVNAQIPQMLGQGQGAGAMAVRPSPLAIGPGAGGGGMAVPAGNALTMGQTAQTAQTATIPGQVRMAPRLAIGPGPLATSAADDILAQAAARSGAAAGAAGSVVGAIPNSGALGAMQGPQMAGGFLARNGMAMPQGAGGWARAGMRAAPAMIGGQMVGGLADGLDIGGENSMIDQGLMGAIKGAGVGGGAALALGASGPVGWAAAGAGALAFGGYKALTASGKDTATQMREAADATRGTIQELGGMYGLDQNAMNDIMMEFDVTTRMMQEAGDKVGMEAFIANMSTSLPALMGQKRQEQIGMEQRMAMQAQFAPIFQQTMTNATMASERAFATAGTVADQLANTQPQLANLVRSGAAQSAEAAQRLYAGYAKQMAMSPSTTSDTAELQRRVDEQALMDQMMG